MKDRLLVVVDFSTNVCDTHYNQFRKTEHAEFEELEPGDVTECWWNDCKNNARYSATWGGDVWMDNDKREWNPSEEQHSD